MMGETQPFKLMHTLLQGHQNPSTFSLSGSLAILQNVCLFPDRKCQISTGFHGRCSAAWQVARCLLQVTRIPSRAHN